MFFTGISFEFFFPKQLEMSNANVSHIPSDGSFPLYFFNVSYILCVNIQNSRNMQNEISCNIQYYGGKYCKQPRALWVSLTARGDQSQCIKILLLLVCALICLEMTQSSLLVA